MTFYSRLSVRTDVLSALAHWISILGRRLARLPRKTATQRLTTLIAALPGSPSAHLDPETISARLIALFPRRAGSNIPSCETLLSVGATTNLRAIYLIFIYVILASFMLGAEWITARRQPPARVDSAHVPAASEVFP